MRWDAHHVCHVFRATFAWRWSAWRSPMMSFASNIGNFFVYLFLKEIHMLACLLVLKTPEMCHGHTHIDLSHQIYICVWKLHSHTLYNARTDYGNRFFFQCSVQNRTVSAVFRFSHPWFALVAGRQSIMEKHAQTSKKLTSDRVEPPAPGLNLVFFWGEVFF